MHRHSKINLVLVTTMLIAACGEEMPATQPPEIVINVPPQPPQEITVEVKTPTVMSDCQGRYFCGEGTTLRESDMSCVGTTPVATTTTSPKQCGYDFVVFGGNNQTTVSPSDVVYLYFTVYACNRVTMNGLRISLAYRGPDPTPFSRITRIGFSYQNRVVGNMMVNGRYATFTFDEPITIQPGVPEPFGVFISISNAVPTTEYGVYLDGIETPGLVLSQNYNTVLNFTVE